MATNHHKKDAMGFIASLDTPKVSNNPSPFDADCARQLATRVKERRRSQRPIYVGVWARQFQRLRELDKVPEDEIATVLTWYLPHLGTPYTPEAFSGESFRNKFDAIKRAMERDGGPAIAISTEAKEIAKRLDTYHNWPKGSASQLPKVVQQSLNNYSVFLKRLNKLRNAHEERHRIHRFLTWLAPHLGRPKDFMVSWFETVLSRIAKWDEWSGDLKHFTFKHDHKIFMATGRGWAAEYFGDATAWNQIIGKL